MGPSRIVATSVVVGTLLFSGTALAPSQEDEKCWRKVEDYDVHFSIFQSAFGDRPFCQDAPTTGDTALTLDFTDPALRQMPTEVRLIEAESWDAAEDPEADAVGKPVGQLPSKTYSSGTVLLEHKFNAPGYFVEVVSIQDSTGKKHVLRYPFQLGQGFGMSSAAIGAVVGFVALILVILLWLQRRHRRRVIEL